MADEPNDERAPTSPDAEKGSCTAATAADGADAALRTAVPPTIAADAAAPSAKPSFRKRMGARLASATDVINDNLIVVRYATASSVLLLGLYGIAITPLFYRYTNLLDIPSRTYVKRKWIHGRLVGVMEREAARDANATTTRPQPIVVLFRHSSPMERLLTQSAMERVLSFAGKSPSRLLYSAANPYRNLLPVELAGVAAPPAPSSNAPPSILSASLKGGGPGDRFPTLDRLVREKAKLSLQLLARRTAPGNAPNRTELEGKQLPGDGESEDAAIGHLHYRKPDQWISTIDASLEMVGMGEACLNPSGTVVPLSETDDGNLDNESNTAIADFDPTVKQLQQDAAFVSQLEEAEYAAWKAKRGMWSSERARDTRREYAEEAAAARGVWRAWARRGLGWLSGDRWGDILLSDAWVRWRQHSQHCRRVLFIGRLTTSRTREVWLCALCATYHFWGRAQDDGVQNPGQYSFEPTWRTFRDARGKTATLYTIGSATHLEEKIKEAQLKITFVDTGDNAEFISQWNGVTQDRKLFVKELDTRGVYTSGDNWPVTKDILS